MNLKKYQNDTLTVLKEFFINCRIAGAQEAYKKITGRPDIKARLGKLGGNYTAWPAIPNTPRVCLKVPTGGGKTILAAHAIKVTAAAWLEREFPVVLWFCPTDTIRRQTAEALKQPRHPYREALDDQFGGKVRVFDIDEKFNIRPQDIAGGVCVVVSTTSAFIKEDTKKYNVYRDNEELEPHFAKIPADSGMEFDGEKKRVKYSFANLLHHQQPIIIVDEAHKVVSELSQETLKRINPSAVIELTATPQVANNTLYNVRASELKDEEMIKLPIALVENIGWEQAVDQALARRAELDKLADGEDDYIRPILLFQAQSRKEGNEVTVSVLKDYLLATANIPANEIAVVTGEQKELDGINIFSRDCPVKYIVTVEALKEGWDCSFAYVLCSLANVHSDTSVLQLLGRVMRMPYAARRKNAELNKAYAYVLSPTFGDAAQTLVARLGEKGFDAEEAQSAVEQEPGELFADADSDRVELQQPFPADKLPLSMRLTGGNTVEFTKNTTAADVEEFCRHVKDDGKIFEIKGKFALFQKREESPSAAQRGEKFTVPALLMESQGELVLADGERIFEDFDWDVARYVTPKQAADGFGIVPQGNGFVIDLDGERLRHSYDDKNQAALPLTGESVWKSTNLIEWLDKNLHQDDIPQASMMEWLRQTVEHLTDTRGLKLSELVIAKYVLANKLEQKIAAARERARELAFQAYMDFIKRAERTMLDFDNGFEFRDGMYEGEPTHRGRYRFAHHFLGANKVPVIDGGETGEEFQCALALDTLTAVKYWLRNVSKHSNSFRLPTSTDFFYPDFVAQLSDGRVLVVEYKGALTATTSDTKEKTMIGELWEKHMGGKGLFMVAEKIKDGLTVREQIERKINRC